MTAPTRRQVLKWLGLGTGAAVVGVAAARAGYQGLFAPRTGPAYAAWHQPVAGSEGLVAAAVLAASAHNMQNWRFHLGDGVLEISDDATRSLGAVDAHRREAHLGIGCALANAEVAAPALGFSPSFVVRPEGGGPDLLARLTLAPRAAAVPDELFGAIPDRHSDRGPYPAEEPSAGLLDEVRSVALSGSSHVELVWVTAPAARARLGSLLVDAAQALVDDERMSVDNAELVRYDHGQVERRMDGLTMDAQGMSPLLTVLAQLAPAVPRRQADGSWVKATREVHTATARAYGVVLGDRDDVATRVHAGRAVERLHLALVARGWAMQHMNQAVEMAERDQLLGAADRFDGPLAGLAGGRVVTVVRVGRPSGRAVPSPRRPVSQVLG
jgi:nitroreductase